jgi:CRP-like cAMP-binding protein/rhodanese-related sulfurtransferase
MTPNESIENILSKSHIFRDLPKDALEAICRAVQEKEVPRGTVIFREGDPGDSLYVLRSGRVRVFRKDEQGMQIDLSVQGPGESFGEMALLTGEPRSADVETLENSELLVIPREDFERILRDYPAISKAFVKEMRRWLLRDEKRLEMEVKEAYQASRVSWFDFLLVLGISAILAVIFNHSNPNALPLFPELPDRSSIGTVTPAEAREEVQQGEATLLDAMPENFFKKRHIKGAVNMPLSLFDIVYMMTFDEADKDRKIIVYGSSISKFYDLELANKLILRGHGNVKILEGGLPGWEEKGYPVEEKAKK